MEVLSRQEARRLSVTKICNGTRKSLLEGLSLAEYIMAKEAKCLQERPNCSKGSSLVNSAKTVLERKIVPLSYLWTKYFHTPYDCEKAQRRLQQMPLVAVKVNGRVFILEKDSECSDYDAKAIDQDGLPEKGSNLMSKDYLQPLSTAKTELEQQLLKHTLCSVYNLSQKRASTMYGIRELKKRTEKVEDTSKKAEDIRERHEAAMKKEQEIFLNSKGVDPSKLTSISSESDTNSEYSDSSCDSDCDDDNVEGESEVSAQRRERLFVENDVPVPNGAQHFDVSDSNISSVDKTAKQSPLIDINFTVVLDKLREMSCNWFAFVASLQQQFRDQGYSEVVLDQFLLDFVSQLSELGLTDEEYRLTEQSRVAYLETLRQREVNNDRLPMPIESSDEEDNSNLEDEPAGIANQNIKNKLQQIKDRHRKRMKMEIALNRLLRKKTMRSTKTILNTFPDIMRLRRHLLKRVIVELTTGGGLELTSFQVIQRRPRE